MHRTVKADAMDRPPFSSGVGTADSLSEKLVERCGKTGDEGRLSLQHCNAFTLAHGRFSLEASGQAAWFDTERANLRARVEVIEASRLILAFQTRMGARISITTKKGVQHAASSDHAPGDPEHPLGRPRFWKKSHENLKGIDISASGASELVDAFACFPKATTLDHLIAVKLTVSETLLDRP